MSGESVLFNDPAGSFIVTSSDGQVAFDSRLPTQVIFMRGTADVIGPGSQGINSTSLFVPYGKPFSKIPYVRSASRLIDSQPNGAHPQQLNFYPPQMSYSKLVANGTQFFSGNYTAAQMVGLYLGNAMQSGAPRGRLRFVFAVFENPVQ